MRYLCNISSIFRNVWKLKKNVKNVFFYIYGVKWVWDAVALLAKPLRGLWCCSWGTYVILHAIFDLSEFWIRR